MKCPRCGNPTNRTIKNVCVGCYNSARRHGESLAQFAGPKTVNQSARELAGEVTNCAGLIPEGYLTEVQIPYMYGENERGPREGVGDRRHRNGMTYGCALDHRDRWWIDLLGPETLARMLAQQEKNRKKVKKAQSAGCKT